MHYDCDTLLLSVGLLPENELSKEIGIELSPVTNGAVVNDRLETSVDGVFACGNVLHVHDLVDYVSEEASKAGENAAKYIQGAFKQDAAAVPVEVSGGVRYTVPQKIAPDAMADRLTVRFRVADVYRNKAVAVYLNEECISRQKKRVLAPGEMEQVVLTKEQLMNAGNLTKITVALEDA